MKRLLPAYPIWVIDPMFSVWSPSETLNGGDTIFWTGKIRKTYGLVRYDGKTYKMSLSVHTRPIMYFHARNLFCGCPLFHR